MSNLFQTNSFQKLENEISGLALLYFKAVSLSKKDNKERHIEFISLVRKAYEKLSQEERKLINNDFFYQKYPYWWKDDYTLSSYRKLKYRSMSHFLEEFYDGAI